MRKIAFTKMQGTGNDFILVQEKSIAALRFWTEKRVWIICDRHLGIGADGLILLTPQGRRGEYDFRIYNADGSGAETCINGLRCAASLVARGKTETVFHPPAGPVRTIILDRRGPIATVRVNLGVPQYQALTLPPLGRGRNKMPVTAISVGNPHLVILVKDFAFDWPAVALRVQHESIFPQGANVDFMRVINRSRLELRFYERGVGPTLSCGSGAMAAALSAMRDDLINNSATLITQGGKLKINYDPLSDHVYLAGPAVRVFSGTIDIE